MMKKTVVTFVLAIVLIVSACLPVIAAQKDDTVEIKSYIGIDKSNPKQPKVFGSAEVTSKHPHLKHINIHGVLTTKAGTTNENYMTIAEQQQLGTSYRASNPATCKVVVDFVRGQDYVFTTKAKTYYKNGGESDHTLGEELYIHTSPYMQTYISDMLQQTIDERDETMKKYEKEINRLTSKLSEIKNEHYLPPYENRSNKK